MVYLSYTLLALLAIGINLSASAIVISHASNEDRRPFRRSSVLETRNAVLMSREPRAPPSMYIPVYRRSNEVEIAQLKKQIEKTTSDHDREKLQERLAKLSGSVAVIKVGAATEVDLKEKKIRLEDVYQAKHATRTRKKRG